MWLPLLWSNLPIWKQCNLINTKSKLNEALLLGMNYLSFLMWCNNYFSSALCFGAGAFYFFSIMFFLWLRWYECVSLNYSETVIAVTLAATFRNISLETYIPNLISLTRPNLRYWAKLWQKYFRFPDFWSIPYKSKLS